MRDPIERQAAIDAVKYFYNKYDNDLLDIFVHILENLPSAQPEINDELFSEYCKHRNLLLIAREDFCKMIAQQEQRCVNCGRNANNGGLYKDGRTRCPIEEHYVLPKDGYCHLWEKRKLRGKDGGIK